MSQPFVGEIRLFAGNFAPAGWLFCDGQLLPIAEQEVLFQLIGTTYGGDGEETFALPNFQSRIPIHRGNNFIVGETAGVEQVTLTVQQIPVHTHPLLGTNDTGVFPDPSGKVPARSSTPGVDMYLQDDPTQNMAPQAISPVGGSQPHDNTQPFLCLHFIISLFGIFPSPT